MTKRCQKTAYFNKYLHITKTTGFIKLFNHWSHTRRYRSNIITNKIVIHHQRSPGLENTYDYIALLEHKTSQLFLDTGQSLKSLERMGWIQARWYTSPSLKCLGGFVDLRLLMYWVDRTRVPPWHAMLVKTRAEMTWLPPRHETEATDYSTLQGKSHLCIPFLGIARPQYQFPHSCVCDRFIYSQDWSTYFPAAE